MKREEDLETRVERLEKQMAILLERVSTLTGRVNAAVARRPGPSEALAGEAEGDAADELFSWVGQSALLQRLSTLCFLLVIALILRTVTDSGMIGPQSGSTIGMSYAALLMVMGWRRYEGRNRLAPIYTICGALLMFTIVVETHTRFAALPSELAYIVIMLTGLGMAALSYLYRVPAPIAIGTFGMCLAAAAIDYPQPFFPYLGGILLVANLLGYGAADAHKYAWLRWILLLVTIFMVNLWGVKLAVALLGGQVPAPILAPSFFLPMLALFALAYTATTFSRIQGRSRGRPAWFDLVAPTVNVGWSFLLAKYVMFAGGGPSPILGAAGVMFGLVHGGLAYWHVQYGKPGTRGVNAYVFAGSFLLILALPVALGSTLASLPFLSAIALLVAFASARWQKGSLRWTSYLVQVYASAALALVLFPSAPDSAVLGGTISAALMACLALFHYKWCRATEPPGDSRYFARFDKSDISALFLFLGALLDAFFLLRIVTYQVLVFLLPPEDLAASFGSAQSVIINVSAAVLMLFALAHGKKEVRHVAVLVTVIGGIKVFLYDLIGGMRGLPVVVSVLSFGIATALESFGLSRWHQLTPQGVQDERSGNHGTGNGTGDA